MPRRVQDLRELAGNARSLGAAVQILDAVPELGEGLSDGELDRARTELVAPAYALAADSWRAPAGDPGAVGVLITEGLLIREIRLEGSVATEIASRGDILAAGQRARHVQVGYEVLWHALSPLEVAIIDRAFLRTLGIWPSVLAKLLELALVRSTQVSIEQALRTLDSVDLRLWVLFWELAERCGVPRDTGYEVPVGISPGLLARLVEGPAEDVDRALGRMDEDGVLKREDGLWLLTGEAPAEGRAVPWVPSLGHGRPQEKQALTQDPRG